MPKRPRENAQNASAAADPKKPKNTRIFTRDNGTQWILARDHQGLPMWQRIK